MFWNACIPAVGIFISNDFFSIFPAYFISTCEKITYNIGYLRICVTQCKVIIKYDQYFDAAAAPVKHACLVMCFGSCRAHQDLMYRAPWIQTDFQYPDVALDLAMNLWLEGRIGLEEAENH